MGHRTHNQVDMGTFILHLNKTPSRIAERFLEDLDHTA